MRRTSGATEQPGVDGAHHERDRFADLIRATAIWAVVGGHWFVIAVTEANGTIDGVNALGTIGWTHPLTWIFQVMPLFFFVGGFANAVSLRRHRAHGGDVSSWIVRRFRRLLLPSSVLLAVLVVGAVAAQVAGVEEDSVGTAVWLATVPLWFLAAYLAMVALAPVTYAAHCRWGFAVPVVVLAAVALVDAARIGLDDPWIANVNYVLVWLAVHQLGYALQDGRLPPRPLVGAGVAAAGAVALVALTLVGPYPVSMVNVPGGELQNSEPPTLALCALAVTQIGVVLMIRDVATRWLRRERPWRIVSRIQSVVLTLFLWHMAAALVAALALYGTGLLPVVPLDSTDWVLLRVPWLAGCAVVLAALVAVFGRIERPARHGLSGGRMGSRAATVAALVGVVATVAGMLRIALAGSGAHGPLALPTDALVSYGVGFALLLLSARGSLVVGPGVDPGTFRFSGEWSGPADLGRSRVCPGQGRFSLSARYRQNR